MKSLIRNLALATSTAMLAMGWAHQAQAVVVGQTGTLAGTTRTFNINVSTGQITTPDGGTMLLWGYSMQGQPMQYPGPTMKVNAGNTVVVNLTNSLPNLPASTAPMPVSMIFPGQQGVTATGGSAGMLTQESTGPADTVTYTFIAGQPGTYMYQSGTRPGLQVEMGLVGALIVYPATENLSAPTKAYDTADSGFDREYLFLLTEMDPKIHELVEFGLINNINNTLTHSVLWFVNGRNAPDTLFQDFAPWLNHQPYGALARMHPGEKVLMRLIGGGREQHPWHVHGNNFTQIARDGRLLKSGAAATLADLAISDYTQTVTPGSTYDATFSWTGEKIGWDIYGTGPDHVHSCTDTTPADGYDDTTREWCADHGKALPVVFPENQSLTFGGFWRGSPFLGSLAALPPGEGGLNLNGGVVFMWHSHSEKELVNNDLFPGGMMTFVIIEPTGVLIP